MKETIIMDLDNTLLRSDKSISSHTLEVLARCREQGHRLVLATARSKGAASRVLEQFSPDVFIGYGGALTLWGDVVLQRLAISEEISHGLMKTCLTTPAVDSVFAVNEDVALTNNSDFLLSQDYTHYRYASALGDFKGSYLKISVTCKDTRVVQKIADEFPMLDMLRYTGEDLHRFANKDAIKWNAVAAMAKHFGLSTKSFIAFGDDTNDLEMLQKCGTGIAVKNATPKVKAVADIICDSNDNDGVARWIEDNLLS